MQPLSGNQRPDLLTSLMKGFGPLLDVQISFRVAGARDCAPCQKRAKREGFVAFPKTMAGVGHLKRICKDAFNILTWKCASRHSGVHFFDISTSTSGPKLVCFVYFQFTSKCASRHNRVHFFNISTSKVVRSWCVLCILTWKCASRHNGAHFFNISTSKSGPNVVSFVHFDLDMCFAPQRRAIFHLSSGQLAPHPPL